MRNFDREYLNNKIADLPLSGVTILAGLADAAEQKAALLVALKVGLDDHKPVALLSDKRTEGELISELTTLRKGLRTDSARLGNVDANDWKVVFGDADTFAKSRIFVNCKDTFAITDVCAQLERFMEHGKVQTVVLDLNAFLSLKNTNEFRQYAYNLKPVIDFAKQRNCRIVITTHCDTPFYEWRSLHRFVADNVQLWQLFYGEGTDELYINCFKAE